ncbi:MAG: pseudouridine synthase [Marinilabiliales bacterium]|nr:MAG: pseudouridine synthase [Marinilabiliales bacterium]
MAVLLWFFIIFLACLVIWKASDGFETASEYLGRNLSEGVRGATINAIGSSIPELFTTIFFLLILHNQEGFSGGIGTTAGSAIFNAMVIPAAVILAVLFLGKVRFVKVSRKVIIRDGVMLLVSEFILIYLLSGGTLDWWHGLILMLLYGVYVVVMFTTMKKQKLQAPDPDEIDVDVDIEPRGFFNSLIRLDLAALLVGPKELTAKRAWGLLILATVVIGAASAGLVVACEELGSELNIPVYFVAVILAAAATSVPDTVLSIRDAKKGNYDDAVSNALGSNIFDICFALGFPLFLYTIFFNPIEMTGELLVNVNELRILLFILTSIVFFIFLFSRKLKVLQGIMLFAIYVFFVLFVLGKSIIAGWVQPIADFLEYIALILLS